MQLKNYRDRSVASNDVGAGFQFEFYCEQCMATWSSPFKPYRRGQFTALAQRFTSIGGELAGIFNKYTRIFNDVYRVANAGTAVSGHAASKPYKEALAAAMTEAQNRYHRCDSCKKVVGEECWDEDQQECVVCIRERNQQGRAQVAGGGMVCPNCQAASQGGRFCHECGFDMASTHKSCPGCAAVMPRAARFCTECGHGF